MSQSAIGFACLLALTLGGCGSTSSTGGGQGGGATQQAGTGGIANSGGTSSGGNPGLSGGAAGTSTGGTPNGGSATGGGASSGGAAAAGGDSTSGGSGGSGGANLNPMCSPGAGTKDVGLKSLLDQKTCLTWTKTHTETTLNNRQAAKYCADLDQDGIHDWRVPHPDELATSPTVKTDSTAYISGPTYIPNASGSVQEGCTGNAHSCNVAKYNDTSLTCAWQGVGFTGWVICVYGTPNPGSTESKYAAANCNPCSSELASFKETDCTPFAN